MLKGNLSSFSLGEIFQSLTINNHTGTLKITTRDGGHKCIYFSRGEISLFSSGSPETLRIGEILMRQKKLTSPDLQAALEEQKTTGELLGKILLRKGMIGKDDIRLALETKIREEIYDLFLLTDAEFEFYINHLPEEMFDPLQKNTRIAINTSMVIMEGLRRVDEWRLIQKRLRTFDEIFIPVRGAPGPTGSQSTAQIETQLDGQTPVAELFGVFNGSRFDCAKALYELIEAGRIRPITVEEALIGAHRASEGGDHPKALRFYLHAHGMDPSRIEVLVLMAACLTRLDRHDEAAALQNKVLRLYAERGMQRDALELGKKLIQARETVEPEIIEILFRAALALSEADTARSAGNRLLSQARDEKDYARAEWILGEFQKLDPRDLNLRIELAEVCAKSGNKTRAVSTLEAVSAELEAKDKLKELIKVLLLIFEIDPKRQDVKQRIQKLLVLQERREQRKKRRVTILGGTVIVFLLVSVLPLLYEIKARELFSHAQRLEEISLVSNDFSKVKSAYEEVLRSYSFSTRAGQARMALDRVSRFELQKLQTLDGQKAELERIQARKLQALREAFPGLIKEAKRYEEAGDFQRAFDIYTRISTELGELPGAKAILFPMLVTSNPKGALLEVNGVAQGTTPIVLRAQKGQELSLSLSRNGCEPLQEKVQSGQRWKMHYTLNRRPVDDLKLSGPIQQALVPQGDRLLFPSRDGFLYAVVPGKKEIAWRRRVGRFGDLLSDLGAAQDQVFLGSVSGELLALLAESGKARWRARLGGAILARPVVSPDGRWVAAASVEGEVAIFDSQSGEARGAFRAEDEVVAEPCFVGDALLVGSGDHRLYELSVPDGKPLAAVELLTGIVDGLVAARDSVYFATRDGSVHRYRIGGRRLVWSRALKVEVTGGPAVDADRVYLGTASGELVALSQETGERVWALKVSPGRVGRITLGNGRLFAGTESGDLVAVLSSNGTREWGYKAEAPILAPPLLCFGRLYVPTTNGKVLVMELVE